jgi:uncharacterized protein YecT (DUF1311 family)
MTPNSVPLCLIFGAAVIVALTGPATARPKSGDDCSNRSTALARTLCADADLAEQDKWADAAYKDALAGAEKSARQSLQNDQKAFVKERNDCLPKEQAAAAIATKAPESEGASIGELPPESRADGATPASPAAGDVPKTPDPGAASPADSATAPVADAGADDEPQPSPEETLACLRTAYQGRIAALESMLRRFVDLSIDAPGAVSICGAVESLRSQGKLRLLPRHALVLTVVDDANEMHPSQKMKHLARYLTPDAEKSAAEAAPAWKSGLLGAVAISRAALEPGRPPVWVFSTIAGEGHDRTVLLFEGGDRMADRLSGLLGGDGAGPFEPLFVRFKGRTYAAEQVGAPYSNAPAPGIYALDQSKPVCRASGPRPTG